MAKTEQNELLVVREAMVRVVMERHENPAEWPVAVRRIAESAGLRPERIALNGSLETTCFLVAEEASKGVNRSGLEALRRAVAVYAEGNDTMAVDRPTGAPRTEMPSRDHVRTATLIYLEQKAVDYAHAEAGDEMPLLKLCQAARAHAKACGPREIGKETGVEWATQEALFELGRAAEALFDGEAFGPVLPERETRLRETAIAYARIVRGRR